MSKIKINIAPVLLSKLNILSSSYSIEVGGYLVGEIKDNEIYLKDLLIPDQSISAAHVTISAQDQVNLRRKFGDKVKKIIGHWHCIVSDTPILLSNGSTCTAKELYEMKIKPELVAYDYNDNFKFIKPSHIVKEKSNKIFNFKVNGKEIGVSSDHLFMTQNGWKTAKKLKKGEYIMMLKKIKIKSYNKLKEINKKYKFKFHNIIKRNEKQIEYIEKRTKLKTILPKIVNEDLGFLFGSLISEGCIYKKKIGENNYTSTIVNNDLNFLRKNQKILKKVFNYEANIEPKRMKKDGKGYSSNCLRINNILICKFLLSNGFNYGKHTKRIPKIIMKSNNKVKREFLKSYIIGDGSIDKRNKNNEYCRIYTVYKELAGDFCYLLNSLSYNPLIQKMKQGFEKRNYEYVYQVYYQNKKQNNKNYIIINRKYSNVYFGKIKEINITKGEDIYNIGIPNYHNFVCGNGGFISHNSHHSLGCFWSQTDEDNMRNIMSYNKFFVFVVSSKGDHLIRVSQREPFSYDFNECNFYVKNLTLDLLRKRMNNLVDQNTSNYIEEEVNEDKEDET